jgi:hypothetical protein
MTVLYDARGNEILGALIDQIGNGTVTDARVANATLGALNAEILMDLNGDATVQWDLRTAAMNATLVFEATVDGTNYVALPGWNPITETMTAQVVIVAAFSGTFQINSAGYRRVRCRVSVFTSGNVVVTGRASASLALSYARPVPATLMVTATAAVNTSVTLTLPAAGAGLFHYIRSIELVKLYAVVGVAAGAGVIITSTNLPGGPSWTTEQIVSAVGNAPKVIAKELTAPLKSAAANVATTFIAPAQLQTIWRWNVMYYVGA